MFNREPSFRQPPPPVEDVEPPAPAMSRAELDERRARAIERLLTTPSSFASRRAAQPEEPRRQLVFMGTSQQILSQGIRDAKHSVVEVELFVDKKTSEVYFRTTPGGSLQSTRAVSGKDDRITKLKPMPTGSRPLGRFEPSPADPPPRPV